MSKKGGPAVASILKLIVPAGKATPSPPVGPALGQRGVKSMDFCKQFNDRTKDLILDTPTPVAISIKPDRTFTFAVKSPPTSWLLKRAAGVEKGAAQPGKEIVGTVSLKHIYAIGQIKATDPVMSHIDLKNICKSIIASAKSVGIKVVH
ncbi:mitochondrial 54S ribosomal protein YmL19 [Coemansia sp. RSA 2337]|uniref:Large ribosomal subunit protein uL11m n=1 Tax=Coemansia pectinata TaxID=1052879 RepID=A0A9W8LAX4_9FUNG|nr:mitochondrial 54S ribosomal protein YmL19 [Coemansia sp. S680]KAJ2035409.1 mitochondrial 54S ribosomal protein YmL19 [Coemansia sp. S3946]KAJ2066283.1 mitochondrial 54S ribosomal protein YmL19 [Coemansia sp. S155-1]KAJ2081296.1 mitochondrial 54S ribosomal protein YmL19 [Coemansia sp. S100]KAJ2111034.1 mitochondrial 54S ribosomal protein YmL19 [Coemansia sp. RSA 922]KAJ2348069.1 mitochondrial 54S ribosomal protein YmL19 [Coemansia sp. RSA 2673]KAJ2464072.1 mitochondrial 54S ribosomal protei